MTNNTRAGDGRCGRTVSIRNIMRGAKATMVAGVLVLSGRTNAQLAAPDRPPSTAAVLAAHESAERWVRAWEVPSAPDSILEGVEGAHVALRRAGRVIGRSSAFAENDLALWRATAEAMNDALRRLPLGNDVTRDERLKLFADGMLIDVELAGPLIPLAVERFSDAELQLNPGLDGVAVRATAGDGRAEDRVELAFPAEMLAGNELPHQALARLTARVIGRASAALDDPGPLLRDGTLRFYRFRTVRAAEPVARATPLILHRGSPVQPVTSLDQRSLRSMAAQLATHLTRRSPEGKPPTSTIDVASLARPPAPIAKHLLAILALSRYTELVGDDEEGSTRAQLGRLLAGALERIDADRGLLDDWETASLLMILAGEPVASETTLWRGVLDQKLASALTSDNKGNTSFHKGIPPAFHGLVAYALVIRADVKRDADDPDHDAALATARAAVAHAYLSGLGGRLVAQMPWLGWADVALADATGEPLAGEIGLREMRDLVWKHQLGPTDVSRSDEDVVGGIVFTSSRVPLPTWQTARPLAFLAGAVGDSRITRDHEQLSQVASVIRAARFLRQMQVDRFSAWQYADPRAAEGGIRVSPWDHRLPIDASSITLLAAVETLRGLASATAE